MADSNSLLKERVEILKQIKQIQLEQGKKKESKIPHTHQRFMILTSMLNTRALEESFGNQYKKILKGSKKMNFGIILCSKEFEVSFTSSRFSV